MTVEELKDWLSRGRHIEIEIRNMSERRARLWQELNNVVPAYESDGTMFNPDIRSKEKKMAIYEDLLARLDSRITELKRTDADTQRVIDLMADSTLRTILELRHIERYSWRRIYQKEMHIGQKTAFRYYALALEVLADIITVDEVEL